MSKPAIFIVGHSRSGTGLLRDMLRSHKNLTFPTESHFIPAFFRAYGDPADATEACRLAARILRLDWIGSWRLNIDAEEFSDCRSFRAILERLYGTWAKQEGKPRWGDKTPQYVYEIPTLRLIFPEAQFIHIFRDGRDVALSWNRHPWGSANVFAAATSWKQAILQGRASGAQLPGSQYMEVRYEELISRPSDVMRRVCEYIDEPYADEVTQPNLMDLELQQARRRFPGDSPFHRRLIGGAFTSLTFTSSKVDGTNLEKWKTRMSQEDQALFNSVAGSELTVLGYESSGEMRQIGRLSRFAWRLHNWVFVFIRRLSIGDKSRRIPTAIEMFRAAARSRMASAGRSSS